MAKQNSKEKDSVTLRFKDLSGGRKSLYLDIYQSGDKNHAHKYEFLKLYLLPDTRENKEHNKEVMRSAKVILSQRRIERANGVANIEPDKGSKISLLDYMAKFIEKKQRGGAKPSTLGNYTALANRLKTFKGSPMLSKIDKNWVLDFYHYLDSVLGTKGSLNTYITMFNSVMAQAVRDGLMVKSPCSTIDKGEKRFTRHEQKKIEYLTIGELCALENAYLANYSVKNAFMFCCFTGLRYSDIVTLTWANIIEDEQGQRIVKSMVKTGEVVIVPLSDQAKKYLPTKGDSVNVFSIPSCSGVNQLLKTWGKRANLDKVLHWHVSRHTFATLLLTKGADLYTVSKLLGHQDIKVTQRYAEIVNQKRTDAVNLLNGLL